MKKILAIALIAASCIVVTAYCSTLAAQSDVPSAGDRLDRSADEKPPVAIPPPRYAPISPTKRSQSAQEAYISYSIFSVCTLIIMFLAYRGQKG